MITPRKLFSFAGQIACLTFVILLSSTVQIKQVHAGWPIFNLSCWLTCVAGGVNTDQGCCWIPGDNHCCFPHYSCPASVTAVIDPAVECQPAPPPTDTCKLVGGIFTPDCSMGLACPASGDGACKACSETSVGVCYVSDIQGTINACCAGYVCPSNMGSGIYACEKGNEKINQLLKVISGILLPLAIILGMVLIIHNGYKIMTSQGDPTKLQEGKDGLTSAIIGLIFILMAVSILRVIIKTLVTGDTDPFS